MDSAIVSLCHEREVDVLVIAESNYSQTDLGKLQQALSKQGTTYHPIANQLVMKSPRSELVVFAVHPRRYIEKIKLPAASPLDVTPTDPASRLLALRVRLPGLIGFHLMVVHLRSQQRAEDADLLTRAQNVNAKIRRVELGAKARYGDPARRTVVMGDFNLDPYDDPMVTASGFHAISSRKLATEKGRRVDGQVHPYFYNPMWARFGCETATKRPTGSYYFDKGEAIRKYWHLYDQVILRPDLSGRIVDDTLGLIAKTGSISLTHDGKPDRDDYSDHLPLFFQLNLAP